MLSFSNAKINIGLQVLNKREDGYHNLSTVFYPVHSAADVLEIIPHELSHDTIISYGKTIPLKNQEDNLIIKAVNLLRQHYPNQIPFFSIYLLKNLPMGAGIGGGSSNASCMLKLVNDICKLHISSTQLAHYAAELGSDCPFFLLNKTAYATGRGELLEEYHLDLSEYTIQMICPEIHISTQQAFHQLKLQPESPDIRDLLQFPMERWKNVIHNHFEQTVFPVHPILEKVKQNLYDAGALYASLSGTGATIYGIFPKNKKAEIDLDIPFWEHVED